MISAQQQNKYLENTIRTATPSQLLIMLYDGAIRSCKQAIDAIQKKSHRMRIQAL
ncbi:flagellar protein FliS [Paenibacillus hexagrammi]|uniref:Flagellar protein FliS n=1 Tax=Paenibacillus hexagrammi TaxID=2908839 RepID=A0ABY3SI70_9BACL|nr:flagellar protein FliS [Paenibacillus sp. YPD9-1]UJF33193.1 flagellar protein FliS [Paenibacillus sp. YPD9-1]